MALLIYYEAIRRPLSQQHTSALVHYGTGVRHPPSVVDSGRVGGEGRGGVFPVGGRSLP